jgi:N6-L-threonylcarbamoyladenine synthase
VGYILGVETSCDDTCIALIDRYEIKENLIGRQLHKKGVIPEYAARYHHTSMPLLAEKIFENHDPAALDFIAYTNSPGLIGSLFVGSSFAKALAYKLGKPVMPINHLEGHILIPYWMYEIELPYLCLLISGGHTMLILVQKIGQYKVLARTLDDAIGEVFDKVARCLGLDYPGGPNIEKLAKNAGLKNHYTFPHVMKNRLDFSFSGLKTAAIEHLPENIDDEKKADFAYYFQDHVANLLYEKIKMHQEHLLLLLL